MKKVVVFDLDDTLYKEIDYLKSAFRSISHKLMTDFGYVDFYDEMMHAYSEKKNVFESLNDWSGKLLPMQYYLDIYRNHIPNIKLDRDTIQTLSSLKCEGIVLGLITDGRSKTQYNKIYSLGLDKFIDKEYMLISEEFGSEKPSEKNFLYFSEKIPDGQFYYIGDNLLKDFLAPNRLGWTSICLLDNGLNVHKQIFNLEHDYQPKYIINSINDIIQIVSKE